MSIRKTRNGWEVKSESTKRSLGGPYKTREAAEKRLQEVEYFKQKAKSEK